VHHVKHDFGHVYLISPRELLLLSCFFVVISRDSGGVLFLFFIKEGCDSVLSPELLPCLSREVVDYLTSESNAGHGVQDDFVGDHVAYSQHFAIETGFNPVDVLSLSQACSDHGSAKIYEH
jgi:hypothetical protein